jgi:SnoaL-like protein
MGVLRLHVGLRSLRCVSGRATSRAYDCQVTFARARQFIEAVTAHDFEAAEALLDPDVETVTPRSTLRGIAACRQVLQKASGDEQFALEQAEPEFEESEGDVIARTHEIARWRESGDVAYERDFAVRLSLVVMPGGEPSQPEGPSQAPPSRP